MNNSEISGNYNNAGTPGGNIAFSGNNTLIARNRFSGPQRSKIYSSADNRFYLNDFNGLDFYGEQNNFFDDGVKNGNHWYNYDDPSEGCLDLDKNDRCDTEYIVRDNPLIKDRFPLIQGRVDLAPHPTTTNRYGIEPVQVLAGVFEGSELIKGKDTQLRVFVDLLNEKNVVQRDLNLLEKPITVKGKIGNQEDSTRVYFANWYDYRDPDPIANDDKNFTYALPADHSFSPGIVNYFKQYAHDKDINAVRKLVKDYGIDAVNLFSNRTASVSDNPTTVSIQIDPDNDLAEEAEYNNNRSYDFAVRQLKPSVKFEINIYSIQAYPFSRERVNLLRFIFDDQWDYLIQNYPFPKDILKSIPFKTVPNPCPLSSNQPGDVTKCREILVQKNILKPFETHEIYYFPKAVFFTKTTPRTDARGITRRRIAAVHENVGYYTSAHEMAHTFGILEQYWLNGIMEEPEWRNNNNMSSFPFGFMSCGKIDYTTGRISTDTCYGTVDSSWPPTSKVSAKPFDGKADYSPNYYYSSPNYYSFMSNGGLSGELTFNPNDFWVANYHARWLDPLTREKLWKALTVPVGGMLTGDSDLSVERIVAVSGHIVDQNIEILPLLVGDGIATQDFNGTFSEIIEIEIQDSNMQTLAVQKVRPDFSTIEDQNVWEFSAGIPFQMEANRIIIKRNGNIIWEKIVSENTPVVTINSVNEVGNDLFSIDWNVSDADNDEMFYYVEYTQNGVDFKPVILSQQYTGGPFDFNAQAYYAGSNSAFLRFTVTDGVNTATADTNTFVVSNKGPLGAIVSPSPGANVDSDQNVLFEGFGYDEEDGQLPDNAFSWESSLQGFLGTGQTLDFNGLRIGRHEITLTITDSQGLQATDQIEVNGCKNAGNGLMACFATTRPKNP
ncbi:MAG: hypothetical protein HY392_04430 [Candidatus Diapherotrites archaeon]|nr:hypothetical protein [Candidatus Diapherotrites archaeon]